MSSQIKNVVVFGASGKVGQELVKQAADRGLTVTAVVRSASSLPEAISALSGVKVVVGDIRDEQFVDSCVAGQDLVFSALGFRLPGFAIWNKPPEPDFLRVTTDNILKAMRHHNVKRACIVGAAGTNESYKKVNLIFRIIINVTALSNVYPLLAEVERTFLDAKDLDIMMTRPVGLTDTPKTEKVRVVETTDRNSSMISRANVAWFMLEKSLTEAQYSDKSPIIADGI